MRKPRPIFRELAVEQIERDPDQPRKDFGVAGDQNRLLLSIETYGIEDPIKVSEIEDDRYLIIDGHRRYMCAQKLGLKTVPCRIYPKMPGGELEARRFEMQNNRRNWKPFEKSNALHHIKSKFNLHTNKELAEILGLSTTMVSNSLQLRDQNVDWLGLMEKYDLPYSQRVEFVRLKPKIRKIRNFEIDDIIKILFEKVKNNVSRNSRDFRKLGKIFLRAATNESELYDFLSNPDMTVSELDQRTLQSGFSLHIEQAIQAVATKRKEGVAFSTKEKGMLTQLRNLLQKVL